MTEDGFVVTQKDGTIMEINNSYCEFLGTNKKYAIGKNIDEFIKNTKMKKIIKDKIKEKDVIHEFVEGQEYKGDNLVIVSRSPIIKDGEAVAGVAQVKFRNKTMNLLKKLEAKNIQLEKQSNTIKKQDNELAYYKEEFKRIGRDTYSLDSIIGSDESFVKVKKIAKKAALSNLPVLITGETGTGKEVFAKGIHYESKRGNNILVSINCAAIPSDLLEMELFGYEEGAFTGAKKGGKKGKFEIANNGTIFLDEIGDMPLRMQSKLLRVLQEKKIERIGGYESIPVNSRIIAATNKNLWKLVKEKKFREDLYYRLNVINFTIPPLRKRSNDITDFINYFLEDLNKKYKKNIRLTKRAKKLMLNHKWSGNIRELKNVIESAFVLAENNIIGVKNLPANLLTCSISEDEKTKKCFLDEIVNLFEKDILIETIIENNYNMSLTADKLGIHRTTLYKKFDRLNIDVNELKSKNMFNVD